jgi:hypothetical protein
MATHGKAARPHHHPLSLTVRQPGPATTPLSLSPRATRPHPVPSPPPLSHRLLGPTTTPLSHRPFLSPGVGSSLQPPHSPAAPSPSLSNLLPVLLSPQRDGVRQAAGRRGRPRGDGGRACRRGCVPLHSIPGCGVTEADHGRGDSGWACRRGWYPSTPSPVAGRRRPAATQLAVLLRPGLMRWRGRYPSSGMVAGEAMERQRPQVRWSRPRISPVVGPSSSPPQDPAADPSSSPPKIWRPTLPPLHPKIRRPAPKVLSLSLSHIFLFC